MKKYFLWAVVMLLQWGCSATLPKPLAPPHIENIPNFVRIDFPNKGQYQIKRNILVQVAGTASVQEVSLPVKQSQFMDVLEKHRAAKALVIDGDADYRVVFQAFNTLPNRVSAPVITIGIGAVILVPFGSALMLVPWPDFASGSVKLSVLNGNGEVLDTIEEKGRFWYCNWGPLLFTNFGRRKAQQLYQALSDRAAVRTLEVIQKDRAGTLAPTVNP